MLSRKGAALGDVDLLVSFETMRVPELPPNAMHVVFPMSVMKLGC